MKFEINYLIFLLVFGSLIWFLTSYNILNFKKHYGPIILFTFAIILYIFFYKKPVHKKSESKLLNYDKISLSPEQEGFLRWKIVEGAKKDLFDFAKKQGIVLLIAFSFISVFGISAYINHFFADTRVEAEIVKRTLIKAEKHLKELERFEGILDTLKEKSEKVDSLLKISVQVDSIITKQRFEIGKLANYREVYQKDMEKYEKNLNNLVKKLSRENPNLIPVQDQIVASQKIIQQERKKLQENGKYRIMIKYEKDTKNIAEICKNTLIDSGFVGSELIALSNTQRLFYLNRSYQICYYHGNDFQKAREIQKLLSSVHNFSINEDTSSQELPSSFTVWIIE